MANYRETTGPATSYRRSFAVHMSNPLSGARHVVFEEEDVTTLPDGRQVRHMAGGVNGSFNPTAVIELRDPATGALTGATMTHMDLYVALHSLYLQLAAERDAAAAAQATTPTAV